MTDPRNLSIADFTYSLPEEKIARYPLPDRDSSKLLIYRDGKIEEDNYRNIPNHIPPGALLVFNDTKVIEARLLFQKETGATVEIFCLEPHEKYPDISTAMQQQGSVLWQCLVGGASKWKRGQVLEKKQILENEVVTLQASYIEKKGDSFVIEMRWSPSTLSFAEILNHTGAIPLPPYLKRKAEPADAERYQTVYAHFDGSVAAPTAGLHFTQNILEQLQAKQIDTDFVTLHVGAGTFKPVKAGIMDEHEMHPEFIDVTKATIENLAAHLDKDIITVGTTSLRTIESLYWLGVQDKHPDGLELSQWAPYDLRNDTPAAGALGSLLDWMEHNKLEKLRAKTRIIIAPGYKPRIAKALITNFHQPQSTLLLLVAALIGDDWRKVYDYALENDFRFLSYGDGSLLWTGQF